MSENIQVKLDVFEGPLDLLLHLIQTLEVDIYDIPIAEITQQYMNYIHTMQTLELDVAGEYIVMAATLMSIKSKMLLPKTELFVDEETAEFYEGEDPRDALVQQLLEYRKFKYAAEILQDKESERGQYFTKEPSNFDEWKEEIIPLDPNQITTIDLFLAFHDILERKKKAKKIETTIQHDHETVEDKMVYVEQFIFNRGVKTGARFAELFVTYTKSEMVTTFMAILELMKAKKIIGKQETSYGDIWLHPLNLD